jgi:hypothetical protein
MPSKALEERVEELERRVAELEANATRGYTVLPARFAQPESQSER